MRSRNPALTAKSFLNPEVVTDEKMSVAGTVNKCLLLFAFLLISSSWVWQQDLFEYNPAIFVGIIAATSVIAAVIIFVPKTASYLAIVYALLEGCLLGVISSLFEKKYPGVVPQAVCATLSIFFVMLFAYRSKLIQATNRFKKVMVIALGGLCCVYLVEIVLRFFGQKIPYIHENNQIGIIFSLIVIGIAALSFVLDFDKIVQSVNKGAPKYMEWYGAFGLMVTIIWLYFEILRFLGKLRSKD